MSGASGAQLKELQLSWGLVPLIHIYVLLWGWSIIFHRLHFPALTLLLKNLNFLWSGFPEEENPGVLHTFLYHFIFPVLKYRRAAESRKKETFFLVFGDSSRFSHRVLCFFHGGLYGAFWICQYNKMSPAFRKIVWVFFSSSIFLMLVSNFIDIFTHYFMVTKQERPALHSGVHWHSVGHGAFISIVAMTEHYKILSMFTIFSP